MKQLGLAQLARARGGPALPTIDQICLTASNALLLLGLAASQPADRFGQTSVAILSVGLFVGATRAYLGESELTFGASSRIGPAAITAAAISTIALLLLAISQDNHTTALASVALIPAALRELSRLRLHGRRLHGSALTSSSIALGALACTLVLPATRGRAEPLIIVWLASCIGGHLLNSWFMQRADARSPKRAVGQPDNRFESHLLASYALLVVGTYVTIWAIGVAASGYEDVGNYRVVVAMYAPTEAVMAGSRVWAIPRKRKDSRGSLRRFLVIWASATLLISAIYGGTLRVLDHLQLLGRLLPVPSDLVTTATTSYLAMVVGMVLTRTGLAGLQMQGRSSTILRMRWTQLASTSLVSIGLVWAKPLDLDSIFLLLGASSVLVGAVSWTEALRSPQDRRDHVPAPL